MPKTKFKDTKDIRDKAIHLAFSENEITQIDTIVKENYYGTRTNFIRVAIFDKKMLLEKPELYHIKIHYEKEKIITMLGDILLQLNLIAWDYISKKGVLQYKERYYKLQNNQIWFLGLNIRERLDKLNEIIPEDAIMSEYSFHHEPPYRIHWHTLFITGIFIKKHVRGSMKIKQ